MRSLRVRSTPHPGHLPTPCTKHDLCTKLLPLIKCGFKLCILYVRNGGRYGGLWIRTCEHRRAILIGTISRTESGEMREDIPGKNQRCSVRPQATCETHGSSC